MITARKSIIKDSIHMKFFIIKKAGYLLVYSDKHGDFSIYILKKIKTIELTSLTFTKKTCNLDEILKINGYNPSYVSYITLAKEEGEKAVIYNLSQNDDHKITNYTKSQRLMDYYLKSLKAEKLLEVVLEEKSDTEYYQLSETSSKNLVSGLGSGIALEDKFKYIFTNWDEKIKCQPDLCLYFGYPYFEFNGNFIPLIYYFAFYDKEKNTLNIDRTNLGVNSKFVTEEMDLLPDEVDEFIKNLKGKSSERLNDFFHEAIQVGEFYQTILDPPPADPRTAHEG